jgi:hypothetical protein
LGLATPPCEKFLATETVTISTTQNRTSKKLQVSMDPYAESLNYTGPIKPKMKICGIGQDSDR